MWCCKMFNNSQDKQTVKCPFNSFSNEVCGLFKYEKHIRQIRKSNKLRLCTHSCSSVNQMMSPECNVAC